MPIKKGHEGAQIKFAFVSLRVTVITEGLKTQSILKEAGIMEPVAIQGAHDEAVRLYALRLLSDGYDVMARVNGWFQAPDYVYGYRPDIVAKKGSQVLIVEIKKGDTDWPKITALQRFGNEKQNFKVLILSPGDVIPNERTGTNAHP